MVGNKQNEVLGLDWISAAKPTDFRAQPEVMEDLKRRQREKSRIFTFVVYAESAPKDFDEYLRHTGLAFAISPMHGHDLVTEEDKASGYYKEHEEIKVSDYKKPHWHVIIKFPNSTTIKHALDVVRPLGCTYILRVHNVNAMTRYLCHLDDPDKAQYPADEIICGNGYDLETYLMPAGNQFISMAHDLQLWVEANPKATFRQALSYFFHYDLDVYDQLRVDNKMFYQFKAICASPYMTDDQKSDNIS